MRRSILTVAVLAAASLAVPAQAAAPTVDLQPQRLTRGADVAVPHVEDGVLVDGERRVDLPGTEAQVLGESGDALLVAVWRTHAGGNPVGGQVLRVGATGVETTVVAGPEARATLLSEDGSRLVSVGDGGRRATVTVRSAADGTRLARRSFDGYPSVTTADDRTVVVQTSRRVLLWRVGPDRLRTLARGLAGPASIEHDLLATYTKDPYLGGCTRLVRLSDRSETVWRSCRERVAAISPDGTELLTFHILTDGLGPGEITLRHTDGARLATWSTGWFSDWGWESPGTVLLDAHGTRRTATVRCTVDACENASDPVRTQAP
jgi:hypothetical protein